MKMQSARYTELKRKTFECKHGHRVSNRNSMQNATKPPALLSQPPLTSLSPSSALNFLLNNTKIQSPAITTTIIINCHYQSILVHPLHHQVSLPLHQHLTQPHPQLRLIPRCQNCSVYCTMSYQIFPQLHKLKTRDIFAIISIKKRRNRLKEVVMMHVCHSMAFGE